MCVRYTVRFMHGDPEIDRQTMRTHFAYLKENKEESCKRGSSETLASRIMNTFCSYK